MRTNAVGPVRSIDLDGARHPVMAVACPSCGARVNVPCKRPPVRQGPAFDFHDARKALAAQGRGTSIGKVYRTGRIPVDRLSELA